MESTHYKRRNSKTFIALLILRLIPAALFLFGVTVIALAKSSVSNSLRTVYKNDPTQFIHLYNYFIAFCLMLFILLTVLLILDAYVEYISFTYAIDTDAFKTRRGIIDIKEMSVLYRHIQNVDIDRPLLYRIMGMSRVVILTAGHEDSDHINEHDDTESVIDLIDNEEAAAIQKELLDRSDVEIVREEPTPVHTS